MPLTDKQEQFCLEYLIDLNATQAAIRAGYSESTARSIASENLTKPDVSARIADLMKERQERTLVTADYVINGLKEVAERSLERVPVREWDYSERALVQKTVVSEDGKEEGVWEFDSMGANKAFELLGKHLKLFTDKVETKSDVKLTSVEVKLVETGRKQINNEKDIPE